MSGSIDPRRKSATSKRLSVATAQDVLEDSERQTSLRSRPSEAQTAQPQVLCRPVSDRERAPVTSTGRTGSETERSKTERGRNADALRRRGCRTAARSAAP